VRDKVRGIETKIDDKVYSLFGSFYKEYIVPILRRTHSFWGRNASASMIGVSAIQYLFLSRISLGRTCVEWPRCIVNTVLEIDSFARKNRDALVHLFLQGRKRVSMVDKQLIWNLDGRSNIFIWMTCFVLCRSVRHNCKVALLLPRETEQLGSCALKQKTASSISQHIVTHDATAQLLR
jgi:hypothetical protein